MAGEFWKSANKSIPIYSMFAFLFARSFISIQILQLFEVVWMEVIANIDNSDENLVEFMDYITYS